MEQKLNVMINEELNKLIHDYQTLHYEVFAEYDEDFPKLLFSLIERFLEFDLVEILEYKVKHLSDLMYIEEEIGISQEEMTRLNVLHLEAQTALRRYKNYRNELFCNSHENE